MAKRTLGIDIQKDGIAWIVVRAGLRKSIIEKSGWVAFQAASDSDPDLTVALNTLNDTVQSSRLTCVVALSVDGMVCRISRAPFRDRKKLRQMLPLDLEPTLPLPVEDLILDFQLIGDASAPEVLTIALDRSRRDADLAGLRAAGFDPEVVTFRGLPSAFLLARYLDKNSTAILVDGDDQRCLFFFIGNGQITAIRNWAPSLSKDPPEKILAVGIHQTLASRFAHSVQPDEIEAVYQTARTAGFYDASKLADFLEAPVRPLPLRDTMAADFTGEWPEERCLEALALSLYAAQADKGLNFYRTTFPLKKFILQNKAHFVRAGVLAALLCGLLITDVALDIRRSHSQLAVLKETAHDVLMETFPDTRHVVDPMQQMLVNVRELRAETSASPGSQNSPPKIDILDELSRAMPTALDIRISQLVAGRERLQISGTTGSFEAVNQAKTALEKRAVFKKLTIVSANMDQGAGRVRYKITADYNIPES